MSAARVHAFSAVLGTRRGSGPPPEHDHLAWAGCSCRVISGYGLVIDGACPMHGLREPVERRCPSCGENVTASGCLACKADALLELHALDGSHDDGEGGAPAQLGGALGRADGRPR